MPFPEISSPSGESNACCFIVTAYMGYSKLHISIKETPREKRPRERLRQFGPRGLSDQELLSIILGSGHKGLPVHELSALLLQAMDRQGTEISLDAMRSIKGLGEAKSSLIAAVLEFGRRRFHSSRQRISYPAEAYPLVRHYADRPQEHFLCLRLNGAHEVMGISTVSIGLVNRTIVHPREVFSQPIEERATAVIVAHNHPSGNVEPSREDISITKRLGESGRILGIDLLDHIIFSREGYYSMLEQGMLDL